MTEDTPDALEVAEEGVGFPEREHVAWMRDGDALVKQVTVTLDLEPDPVIVLGDRVQLQQVVLNLLRNAIDAT